MRRAKIYCHRPPAAETGRTSNAILRRVVGGAAGDGDGPGRRAWPGTTRTCYTCSRGAGCTCCTGVGTTRSTPWIPSRTRSSCSASSSPLAPSSPRWIHQVPVPLFSRSPLYSLSFDTIPKKPSLFISFGAAFIKERLGCLCSPDKVAPSTASARTNTYKLSFMECPSGIKVSCSVTSFMFNLIDIMEEDCIISV